MLQLLKSDGELTSLVGVVIMVDSTYSNMYVGSYTGPYEQDIAYLHLLQDDLPMVANTIVLGAVDSEGVITSAVSDENVWVTYIHLFDKGTDQVIPLLNRLLELQTRSRVNGDIKGELEELLCA